MGLSRTVFLRFAGRAAIVGLALATPTVARAGDTSTAEQLFQEGLAAMQREQFKAACDAFEGSNEADPSPGTEINLALCNEKQGKVATAWGWYRTAAGLADQRGQKERATKARGEAARLEPTLPKLIVVVKTPVEGLTVTRDGTAMPSASVGKEIPVDPGDHAIEVNAKGKKPFKGTVKVAMPTAPNAVAVRFEVPTLEDAPVAAPAVGPGTTVEPPHEKRREGSSTQKNVGYILGGAGILALVAAGGVQIFNLAVVDKDAKDLNSKRVQGNCTDESPNNDRLVDNIACPELNSSYDTKKQAAKDNQLVAILVGAGGVVMLGAGIALVLTAGPSKESSKPKVLPVFGPGYAGFGVSGSF